LNAAPGPLATTAAASSRALSTREDKERAYRARRRRNSLLGLVAAVATVGGAAGLSSVVVHPLVVVGGVVASVVAVMGALACLVPVQVPWLIVVLDRRLSRPQPVGGDVEEHGVALFLFQAVLDAQARDAGVPPLGHFLGQIRAGAARYHPDDVLPTVDALLAGRDKLPDAARLAGTLEDLRNRLVAAREGDARLCLTVTTVWSTAMEDNLHLYWYA
jgi:hypothetical protein